MTDVAIESWLSCHRYVGETTCQVTSLVRAAQVGCPSAPDYEFPDGLFAKRKLWNLPPLPSVTVKGCEIGSAAICPDGGRCDAQTPCCSDGSLCPSWGWMEDPAAGCPHPKKLNCVKGLTKARTLDMCHVGDFVPCPDQSGQQYFCSGDVCCPDGSLCPSASASTSANCRKKTSCVVDQIIT